MACAPVSAEQPVPVLNLPRGERRPQTQSAHKQSLLKHLRLANQVIILLIIDENVVCQLDTSEWCICKEVSLEITSGFVF